MDLQPGTLFLFPAQMADSALPGQTNPNLANIYRVLVNYDSVVVYAKPGFPDVHYLAYHECPEVLLFALKGTPTVPGVDLITPDEIGLLTSQLAFHAYYRDFFAMTFNLLPEYGFLDDSGLLAATAAVNDMRGHCQVACQYHIWRYNQIKARLDGLVSNAIVAPVLKETL